MIGIVRRAASELAKSSDIALVLPAIAEANNINAPTTSTTMMLALGDALAVSLIDARGFNLEKFGALHPGGKLGSAFLKVRDLMRPQKDVPLVEENQKMPEILLQMTSKHLGCTGVVDCFGQIIGIITDGDLRRHIDQDFLNQTAGQIMTKNPITADGEDLAIEAIAIMNKKLITSLLVLDKQKKPAGILHLHDCLRSGVV